MLKFYVVVLKVQIGMYQKLVPHLVRARTFEEAHHAAILGEAHSDPEDLEWADGGAYDLNGELHYKVYRSTEVPQRDWETLTAYL